MHTITVNVQNCHIEELLLCKPSTFANSCELSCGSGSLPILCENIAEYYMDIGHRWHRSVEDYGSFWSTIVKSDPDSLRAYPGQVETKITCPAQRFAECNPRRSYEPN